MRIHPHISHCFPSQGPNKRLGARAATALLAAAALAISLSSCEDEVYAAGTPGVDHAIVTLVPIGDSGVQGIVQLMRTGDGIRVTGKITGLTPGLHGFHVHRYGDLTNRDTGESAGPHFSPAGMPHGRPSADERHVGDLGNIEANEQGVATIELIDEMIAFEGEHSVIGRALVVHEEADQFTQPSGNAGSRVAFGVIGIAEGDTSEY